MRLLSINRARERRPKHDEPEQMTRVERVKNKYLPLRCFAIKSMLAQDRLLVVRDDVSQEDNFGVFRRDILGW